MFIGKTVKENGREDFLSDRDKNSYFAGLSIVFSLSLKGWNVTTYFAETDYLGSIIGLMNPGGTYAEQFSFDAWGRRRNPTNWTYANVPAPTLTERGYTGHEHLDVIGKQKCSENGKCNAVKMGTGIQ